MNPNHETELEALVDRELKSLTPLAAPPSLAPRILAALAARAAVPWYRRAWQEWPMTLQASSLAAMLTLFGTLCFGAWSFSQSEAVAVTAGKVSGVLSMFELALRTLGVLRDAGFQVVQNIGPGFVIGFAVLMVITYAMCLALGSACVRFAMVRR